MDTRFRLIWWTIVPLVVIAVPIVLRENFLLHAVNIGGIFILASFGMDLLYGRAGMLSLGNAAMFAIGAYTSSALVLYSPVPWPIAMLLAGAAAAVIGMIVALPALRMAGIYLGVATYAFVLIVHQFALQWDKARAANGLSVPKATIGPLTVKSPTTWYWVWVVVVVTILVLSRNFLRSRTGRSLAAIRDSEIAARAMGISLFTTKLLVFATAGFVTGIAGSMYAHYLGFIYPDSFELNMTLMLIAMPIIGGSGTIFGATIGALIVSLLPEVLRLLPGDLKDFKFAIYGVIIALILIFEPTGLVGIGRRFMGLLRPRGLLSTVDEQSTSLDNLQLPKAGGSLDKARSFPRTETEGSPSNGTESLTALKITAVTQRFGGLVAVNQVSLDVPEKAIFGLIGPNGAGKSTLLNCVSGFYRPNSGSISYRDIELTTLPSHARARHGIGRTFQNLELFSEATVIDNLLIAQHTKLTSNILTEAVLTQGVRKAEASARDYSMEILEFLALTGVKDRVASELPFALQKRVELGRALAARPSFLLLDEPATGLTPTEIDHLAELIRMLRDYFGITILLVEHNMRLVMRLCDHLAVLNFGLKIAEGAPSEIQENEKVLEAYLGTKSSQTRNR
jgi:branched-chain amino acid transport system permease protein